jgi:hypothetical protein
MTPGKKKIQKLSNTMLEDFITFFFHYFLRRIGSSQNVQDGINLDLGCRL